MPRVDNYVLESGFLGWLYTSMMGISLRPRKEQEHLYGRRMRRECFMIMSVIIPTEQKF